MDDASLSDIDKIKLQEQLKEATLKEKREFDATISTLNKCIREALVQNEKSEQEIQRLTKSTDSLRTQKLLEECRRDTLSAQLISLKEELKKLQNISGDEMRKVWAMRSSFCDEIHSVSDACDVWTLLIKPAYAQPLSQNTQKMVQVPTTSDNENRLKAAREKRVNVLAERDRLATEPNNGEDFLRIKNALRYSMEKIAELQ